MDIFLQQLINGLTLGSIYALVALGYTMVYGILGLINFAHGEVVMIGALTALAAAKALLAAGLPVPLVLLLALLAAALVCMALGATIERVAYRPLRNAPRLAPLITAIGVSIVLQQVAMLVWGRNYHSVPQLLPAGSHEIFGAQITEVQMIIMADCRADHARPDAAGEPHPTRPRHARHLRKSRHRGADGRRCQPHHHAHLRHRLGPGRAGRRHGQRQLRHRPLPHGLPARPQGLHRRRARRHRQPRRRHGRRRCCSA